MAEDLITFFVEDKTSTKLKKSHLNMVAELLGKKASKLVHSYVSAASKRSYMELSGFDSIDLEAVNESLNYLKSELGTTKIYCSLHNDQVNETEYYTLDNRQLLSFTNEAKCLNHIEAKDIDEIAINFFQNADKNKSLLLVKVGFHTVSRLNKFVEALTPFYESPSKDTLELFKRNIPHNDSYSISFLEYFEAIERGESSFDDTGPVSVNHGDLSERFLELFSCISLLKANGKVLYVGFSFDSDVGIETVDEEDYDGCAPSDNYQDVTNRDGEVICNIVQSFVWHTHDVSAKFHSKVPGKSGYFRFMTEIVHYQPLFDLPNLPVNYWPPKIS